MTELNDSDKALLAREVAADRHVGGSGYYDERMREVFCSGWDAALVYVEKQRENQRLDDWQKGYETGMNSG